LILWVIHSRSKKKGRMKGTALALLCGVVAFPAVVAIWVGISVYRIDHAIHHVSVPASLISKGHMDLLMMVKGPDKSEQVFVLHGTGVRQSVLQIPEKLLLPLVGGQTVPIDTLSIRRPATIISGLERLGLPITQFVGVDLHMFSSNSVIGRLATGQTSTSSLISNPLRASSLIEQVASHIYLGPGTPTSAIMSLTTVSTAHAVAIPTKSGPHGSVVLATMSAAVWKVFQ
jgi:hypothetical protein